MAWDWWDLEGPCKPLHEINPLRLSFIQSCCPLTGQQQILDIGCGGGILTEALSCFCPQVTGIDQSTAALEVAIDHAKNLPSPPHYFLSTAEEYAERYPGKFDVITCMELLEHVPDPLSVIAAMTTLLKPGGDLFLSTINRTPKAFLQAIIGAEYLLKLLPKGTHDYARFIRPSELATWARQYQLSLKHSKGLSYRVLNKRYYLTDDVSVNYLFHLQKEAT